MPGARLMAKEENMGEETTHRKRTVMVTSLMKIVPLTKTRKVTVVAVKAVHVGGDHIATFPVVLVEVAVEHGVPDVGFEESRRTDIVIVIVDAVHAGAKVLGKQR